MSFLTQFKRLTARPARYLLGTSVMIDTVNACTFACPSCPVSFTPAKKGMMNVSKFKELLDRIEAQVHVKYILLYSFSEPLLNPWVGEIIGEIKKRGIRVMISTNLSHPQRVEACMKNGLDELRISFSGFKYGEYFHTGRRMPQFIEACQTVSRLQQFYPGTRVQLIFHEYKTTLPELENVKAFADEMEFELIEEPAFFIGWEKIVNNRYTADDLTLISHLQKPPWEANKHLKRQEYCFYQTKQMVFDANGDAFLCRHVYDDKFKVGNVMRDSLEDITKMMKNHSFCVRCKDHKLNQG